MKSWFIIPSHNQSISFPIQLPIKLIEEYSQPGDTVLDVFAGYGTTLLAAEQLGRIGIGIEYEQQRVDAVAQQLKTPSRIIQGDARKLTSYHLPLCDMALSSPPYMRSFDTEHPLTNYHASGSYHLYLEEIGEVYKQMKTILKPNAPVIIEIENTYELDKPVTPLAWDVAAVLSKIFFFEKDLVACAETIGEQTTDHSYILVFRNR